MYIRFLHHYSINIFFKCYLELENSDYIGGIPPQCGFFLPVKSFKSWAKDFCDYLRVNLAKASSRRSVYPHRLGHKINKPWLHMPQIIICSKMSHHYHAKEALGDKRHWAGNLFISSSRFLINPHPQESCVLVLYPNIHYSLDLNE